MQLSTSQYSQLSIGVTVVALSLTLTPFYSIGYLMLVVVYSTRILLPHAFETKLGAYIISSLLLAVSVMVAGLIAWTVNAATWAPLVALIFIASCYLLRIPGQRYRSLTRTDLAAVLLAFIAPALLLVGFFLPQPSHGATLQVLTNGFDNLAHLTLLRTNGIENGYAYGSFDNVKDRTIVSLGSYPQGWHLANAHILNGFGDNVFANASPLKTAYLYFSSLLAWYIIAVYLVTKLSLHMLRLHNRRVGRQDWAIALTTIGALQIIVYWGVLGLGFASFIGCLAYLIVFTASVIDFDKRVYARYIMSVLTAIGLSQTWILPAVGAVIGMAYLLLFDGSKLSRTKVLTNIRAVFMPSRFVPLVVLGLLMLFQIAVLFIFPLRGSTSELLTEPGGIFGISLMLMHVVLFGGTYVWLRHTTNTAVGNRIGVRLLILTLPTFFIAFMLYAYQIVEVGTASYFFTKTALLVIVTAFVFISPATVGLVRSVLGNAHAHFGAAAGIGLLIAVITGTGQPIDNLNYLIQRHSKVGLVTANQTADFLATADTSSTRLVVLKSTPTVIEDTDASYFANRFAFKPELCADTINVTTLTLQRRVARLAKCAKAEPATTYQVITSPETYQAIVNLKLANIQAIQ